MRSIDPKGSETIVKQKMRKYYFTFPSNNRILDIALSDK